MIDPITKALLRKFEITLRPCNDATTIEITLKNYSEGLVVTTRIPREDLVHERAEGFGLRSAVRNMLRDLDAEDSRC